MGEESRARNSEPAGTIGEAFRIANIDVRHHAWLEEQSNDVTSLRIPFDIEILKLIALRHPTIKMVLDYPINTLGNDLVSLRAIRLITHCALAINVNFFRELRGVVEAMRGFAHLRHLELSICGNFINLPNALCHELRGHLNIILPRLEYLSISGQLPRGTRSNAPLSVMNPQGWDLSLLETLRVEDEITCTDLYENLTLTRLKHLLCNRPSFETGPDVAEEFQRLLSRNKDLESLRMVGLTSRSDLLLLSSLGTRLHTLDLAQGSYVEDAQQFATLASLLPNLINLSVFVTHTVTWPYTSLAAVADSFPAIQYLRLRTVPQLVSTRCKIVHRLDGAWSGAYDTIMCENPSTDLDLASKAWRYFWSILVKSNNSSLSQSSGNPTRLSTSPRIETLVLRTERVQALPPFIAGGLRHEFRADRSERLEDSRSGVATVSSQTVENYESYLQDCAFGTDMEDLGNQSHRDVLNLRWTLRVVAEFGPDTRFWPDLGPYELNSEFGRPSVVVP